MANIHGQPGRMAVDRSSSCTPQPALPTHDARALDVTRGELAGPRWRTPHRGVHVPVGSDPKEPLQRIYDRAPKLCPLTARSAGGAPGTCSERASSMAWDSPEPAQEPLPLLLPERLHLGSRKGVVHWRGRLEPEDLVEINGVRATKPVPTAFDVGRRAKTLERAVVSLDVMARQLGVSPQDVGRYARISTLEPEGFPSSGEPCRSSTPGLARSASHGCECCGSWRQACLGPSAIPT